jgi:cytochrome c556
MPMSRYALFAALLLPAASALAEDAPKSETVIGYRQSVFHVIRWNFTPLAEMARGRRPFDAADFKRRAVRLAFLSQQLREGFTPGSDKGATTDARPEIWTNRADFDQKLADFIREAKALREVAKTGDEAKMKEQFGKTANTCKNCHESYRAE